MVDKLDCTNINLKYGSMGGQVTTLQQNLRAQGYYLKYGKSNLVVDGKFLDITYSEVKRFQKDHDLDQDGIVGPITCQKLNQLNNNTTTTNNNTTTTTTNNNTNNKTNKPTPNPYQINTKNNILSTKKSNLHIQGINLNSSTVTPTNTLPGGNWKSIQLANGGTYDYLDYDEPAQYTIETYLTNQEYKKLKNELIKLQKQKCKVTGTKIESGTYLVKITQIADQQLTHIKLTIQLTQTKP